MNREKLEKDAIHETFGAFQRGDFEEAEEILLPGLASDSDEQESLSAMMCARFWKDKKANYDELDGSDCERAEFLLSEWQNFLTFSERLKNLSDRALYSLKRWVFSEALEGYLKALEQQSLEDPDLLFRAGRCFKALGDFDHALEFLETAARRRREDPVILAELADCYACIEETKLAKAFFREAFFLGPDQIELMFMESRLIGKLIETLREMGFDYSTLQEWIPVYGVLFGVFTVKRELRPIEIGKLKQSIYSLELSVREHHDERMKPRLINQYFWLIDHYVCTGESRDKVEDILGRLKNLCLPVYEQYIN